MIQDPIWYPIKIHGLSRYKISETGEVRIVATNKVVPSYYDAGIGKSIFLIKYGLRKKFLISTLLSQTFNIDENSDSIPDVDILPKIEVFSISEDDYGLDENKMYWEEIREQAKRATAIKNADKS